MLSSKKCSVLRCSHLPAGRLGEAPLASGQSPALRLHHRSQRRRGERNRRQGAATWRWQQRRHGDAHPGERHIHTSLCTQCRSVSSVNRLAPTTHRTPLPELLRVDLTDTEWVLVCVLFLFFGASRVFFFFFFSSLISSWCFGAVIQFITRGKTCN